MHLQSLYTDVLLPLGVHTFQFSHRCGKNRLCVRHVCLVTLLLLLPYKLVLSNLSSELSASAFFFFFASFYTGRSSIADSRLRFFKKSKKTNGVQWILVL